MYKNGSFFVETYALVILVSTINAKATLSSTGDTSTSIKRTTKLKTLHTLHEIKVFFYRKKLIGRNSSIK